MSPLAQASEAMSDASSDSASYPSSEQAADEFFDDPASWDYEKNQGHALILKKEYRDAIITGRIHAEFLRIGNGEDKNHLSFRVEFASKQGPDLTVQGARVAMDLPVVPFPVISGNSEVGNRCRCI